MFTGLLTAMYVAARLSNPVETRCYSISDLITTPQHQSTPQLLLTGSAPTLSTDPSTEYIQVKEIITVIKTTIARGKWESDPDNYSINYSSGVLTIKAPHSVQEQIN